MTGKTFLCSLAENVLDFCSLWLHDKRVRPRWHESVKVIVLLYMLYEVEMIAGHHLYRRFACHQGNYVIISCLPHPGGVTINRRRKMHIANNINPMCHLRLAPVAPPHIISVTESGRMQLQVVLKLLWVGINTLTARKPPSLSLLWWIWSLNTLLDVLSMQGLFGVDWSGSLDVPFLISYCTSHDQTRLHRARLHNISDPLLYYSDLLIPSSAWCWMDYRVFSDMNCDKLSVNNSACVSDGVYLRDHLPLPE